MILPIPGGVTLQFVETMVQEYGKDSPVYTSRVLGEFPIDATDSLVKRSWLDASAERWASAMESAAGRRGPVTVGLDPSRLGGDKSCLVWRRGPVLEGIETWGRLDTMELIGRVTEKLNEIGVRPTPREPQPEPSLDAFARPSRSLASRGVGTLSRSTAEIIVDEIGLGGPILDRLKERGFLAKGFNGSRSPWKPKRFLNARAEIFWNLRRLLEDGKIGLPPDEKLFEELTTIRWKPNSDQKLQLEPKDDLRARLGRSPDRADAVAMCFSGMRRQRPRTLSGSYSFRSMGM